MFDDSSAKTCTYITAILVEIMAKTLCDYGHRLRSWMVRFLQTDRGLAPKFTRSTSKTRKNGLRIYVLYNNPRIFSYSNTAHIGNECMPILRSRYTSRINLRQNHPVQSQVAYISRLESSAYRFVCPLKYELSLRRSQTPFETQPRGIDVVEVSAASCFPAELERHTRSSQPSVRDPKFGFCLDSLHRQP